MKHGEPGTEIPAKRSSWTEALVLGAVLSITLAILFGLGVIQPGDRKQPPPPPAPGPVPASPESLALGVLEDFFEGAGLEEKLPAVRDGKRVRPMMEDYHLKRGHPFPTMGRVSPGNPVNFGTRQCVFFEVEPYAGPRFPVSVEWDGFRFGVDWESLTAYGTMDWADFVEKKPETVQTMRVYLTALPDSLRPPGSGGRSAFRMEHRDSDMVLAALAGPDISPDLLKPVKGKRVPATVETAWNPDAAEGGAFEILRVVAQGWSR